MQSWLNIPKPINVIQHINKVKKRKDIIISIDVKKATEKTQHPFLIKNLNKLGIKANFLNLIKGIFENLKANTLLKVFPLRPGSRQ